MRELLLESKGLLRGLGLSWPLHSKVSICANFATLAFTYGPGTVHSIRALARAHLLMGLYKLRPFGPFMHSVFYCMRVYLA